MHYLKTLKLEDSVTNTLMYPQLFSNGFQMYIWQDFMAQKMSFAPF